MDKILTPIKGRIIKFIENQGIKKEDFYSRTDISASNFKGKGRESEIGGEKIVKILTEYPTLSCDWLLTGDGPMLRGTEIAPEMRRNLIPLYNDVASIGGNNGAVANGINTQMPELIDAGDWFPGATAAIRHYGDSMREYPSGSILALKALKEVPRGFVLGQNYVVEYGEDYNRVTKRVQKKDDTYMAYSSNEDKYDDGTLIHQPFELYDIQRAWRILGCVIKTESSRGVIPVGRG